MPTGRGWAALGASAALLLLWIGYGERELLAAALFLTGGTLSGMAFVRRAAPRVAVGRKLAPAQVHEGDRAVVEIIVNARKLVRNLVIEDEVVGLGSARFAAGKVEPGVPLTARYEILCRPRGIYQVGPARAMVNDPLGLAEARATMGGMTRLIVYPSVEDLEGFPVVHGQDPSVQTAKPTFSHHGGEDFFTLREYQVGDDLRRVHWPSSAKRDALMIKQLEIPWQSRALLLFDHRARVYRNGEAFEQAVRGAASAIRHLFRGGFYPDMWTLEAVPTARGRDRYRAAMEQLATIQTVRDVDLHRTVSRMRKRGAGGGALVLVTGNPDEADLAAFRTLSRDFARSLVLAVGSPEPAIIAGFQRGGAVTVVISPNQRWSPAWDEAMERSWSTVTAG